MNSNENSGTVIEPRKQTMLEFDEDGFLKDPAQWDESVASFIARQDGVGELTKEQWVLIRSMRSEYFKHQAPLGSRFVCHINNMQKNCFDSLFDHNTLEAWRIAGLPNPGEEAKAYM